MSRSAANCHLNLPEFGRGRVHSLWTRAKKLPGRDEAVSNVQADADCEARPDPRSPVSEAPVPIGNPPRRCLLPPTHELVQIVGREPPLAARRAIRPDKPLVRPFAKGSGANAQVVGGLPYGQQSSYLRDHVLTALRIRAKRNRTVQSLNQPLTALNTVSNIARGRAPRRARAGGRSQLSSVGVRTNDGRVGEAVAAVPPLSVRSRVRSPSLHMRDGVDDLCLE